MLLWQRVPEQWSWREGQDLVSLPFDYWQGHDSVTWDDHRWKQKQCRLLRFVLKNNLITAFLTLLSTKIVAAVCNVNGHYCGCFLVLKRFCYCSCRQNSLFFVLRDYVVRGISSIEVTPTSWKALGDYQHRSDMGALFGINHGLSEIPLGNGDFFPA